MRATKHGLARQSGKTAEKPDKRLRPQDCERQRHRFRECQLAADEDGVSHGDPGQRQELLSVEHPGVADLVRDPSQQGRLPGALGLCRHHGCDERADVRARPARGGARRRLALRLDLAARSAVGACRYRGHRRAARANVQRAVRERAHAHPHEEHGVRRRAGRAARARPRRHRGIDQGDLCAQARAHRVEPASDRPRASTMRVRISNVRCRTA